VIAFISSKWGWQLTNGTKKQPPKAVQLFHKPSPHLLFKSLRNTAAKISTQQRLIAASHALQRGSSANIEIVRKGVRGNSFLLNEPGFLTAAARRNSAEIHTSSPSSFFGYSYTNDTGLDGKSFFTGLEKVKERKLLSRQNGPRAAPALNAL
jgi:hypothetical protein